MAFPDFGGPVAKPVDVQETAAARYARDVAAQGGEQVLTVANGASLASYTEAAPIAATATGGRTDRALLKESKERKDRLYVDIATGVSAVTGTKDEDFDALKAGVEDANMGAAQSALVNYDGMSATSPLDEDA